MNKKIHKKAISISEVHILPYYTSFLTLVTTKVIFVLFWLFKTELNIGMILVEENVAFKIILGGGEKILTGHFVRLYIRNCNIWKRSIFLFINVRLCKLYRYCPQKQNSTLITNIAIFILIKTLTFKQMHSQKLQPFLQTPILFPGGEKYIQIPIDKTG